MRVIVESESERPAQSPPADVTVAEQAADVMDAGSSVAVAGMAGAGMAGDGTELRMTGATDAGPVPGDLLAVIEAQERPGSTGFTDGQAMDGGQASV